MYLSEHIEDLNYSGVLSTALLARKYRINFEHAREILLEIVTNHENVKFRTPDQIYIEGRELESWKSKPKKIRIRTKKPLRWKDITRP